ncbi:hypothetical protein NBG4_890002 [Candidatus Sulfobium mesophilum]|uniref:Zinc finger CHC2-type domain-containing protein n=1 Tax=Candidatus Sulfobium mesophilum TaxID=2016548 RepID=A0A2U3QKV7_9BACT|nr:hypothetical protein NBG4_890002 [Candidatus Sulfobium mesophilum]
MTDKPDIVSVIQSEGIELRQRGRDFWGRCPFHPEKTASFKVSPARQTYYCFGCNAHGDVLDFIQKRKGLSFKDTLTFLGMAPGKLDAQAKKRIEHEKKKRAAIAAFKAWCDSEYNRLADTYRRLQQSKARCRTWEDVERIASLYHAESLWQLRMDILSSHDEQQKFKLYEEVTRHAA